MMLSSWVGTDFTNDDLVRDSSYAHDFDIQSAGRDAKLSNGWLFVFTVKPLVVGRWDKIEFVLNEGGTLPLEARFYDRQGRLARIMKFFDVNTFGQRTIPTRLVLESVDQPGHKTQTHYLDMKFDVDIRRE